MKHYIYLLLAVIMFAACGSSKKVESSQKLVLKDSVNIRDSIVFKDSTMPFGFLFSLAFVALYITL